MYSGKWMRRPKADFRPAVGDVRDGAGKAFSDRKGPYYGYAVRDDGMMTAHGTASEVLVGVGYYAKN